MMEIINALDEWVLLLFNGHHTPLMDNVMWLVSGKFIWIPFYILLLELMARRIGWKRAGIVLIGIALAVTLADQVCGSLLRGLICRMRPSNPDNPFSAMITLVNDYHGGKYGFPSCHAANTMALAVMMICVFRTRAMLALMITWSVVVSCSRMYLGVHYPTDILAGWFIGGSFSYLIYYFGRGVAGLRTIPVKRRAEAAA